ncbi:MAG TPA: amidohydrolase [Solirubrobacteraceae bacterium]
MPPDRRDGRLALLGGRIRTLDARDSVVEAIAIDGGRVVSVGSDAEVMASLPRDAPVVALEGRTVLPGLIDAHTHLELSALAEHWWLDVRGQTPAATLARVTAAVAARAPGEWLVGQGTFGQELPSRAELDEVAPANPVVLRQSMHLLVANSAAMRASGIDRHYAAPRGTRVVRDHRGDPSGVVREGFDLFPVPWPADDEHRVQLRDQTRALFVRRGVTTIHELPASEQGIRAWQRLLADGELPCRITLNPILSPGHQPTVASLDDFLALGVDLERRSAEAWLTLGALKLFLDGGDLDTGFSRAALAADPRDWGILNFTYEELVAILMGCRHHAVQVWMHAIGDAAQAMALDAVEDVNLACGESDHRTRVEHIGNHLCDWSVLPRMRAAGIVPVPNVVFLHQEADDLDAQLGADARAYAYRSMIEAGLCTPGNSDTAGAQPMSANPWFAISAMVRRRTAGGVALSPDEAVDVRTALETYTGHGAYAAYEEDAKGTLEPGKLGDLAVYAEDPLALDPADLVDLAADMTVVGGVVVHDSTAQR